MHVLWWIHLPYATFGIESQGSRVVRAAPIAGWSVGRDIEDVKAFYRGKGADIRYRVIVPAAAPVAVARG